MNMLLLFRVRRSCGWIAVGVGIILFYVILIPNTWKSHSSSLFFMEWFVMLNRMIFLPLFPGWAWGTPAHLLGLLMIPCLLLGIGPVWQQPLPLAWMRRRWLADIGRVCFFFGCLDCAFVLFHVFGDYPL